MPSQKGNLISQRVTWDYSELARHYDERAPYADGLPNWLFSNSGLGPKDRACDMGAGTGALTKVLLALQLKVTAVEPNRAMRERGRARLRGQPVEWVDAVAEETGLPDGRFSLVSFGSSFNVTDKESALKESARLLQNNGWLLLLWNHRDLADPLQAEIEALIRQRLPSYHYGNRREDQRRLLDTHEFFGPVNCIDLLQSHELRKDHFKRAWRSHGTLQRQAGAQFEDICLAIDKLLDSRPGATVVVPYVTRAYLSQRMP